MNREFLMLAHVYENQRIDGWFLSEKLDGQRAWYDGGITRGMLASEVPWANTAKDSRLLVTPRATGLWSRYGHVIRAPDSWLDQMPKWSLDLELWLGRNRHQELRTIIARHDAGGDWSEVKAMVFDVPSPDLVLAPGRINNVNFKKEIGIDYAHWFQKHGGCDVRSADASSVFKSRVWRMEHDVSNIEAGGVCKIHTQYVLSQKDSLNIVKDWCALGAEGGMVRDPMSLWVPKRTKECLKIKPSLDSEATVIGYTWGRLTDKGSKLLGLMGNLIVEWNGKKFELSGFTDEERKMIYKTTPGNFGLEAYFKTHAGQAVDLIFWRSDSFPLGSQVTFTYRELTDAGIPKEARYHRKFESC